MKMVDVECANCFVLFERSKKEIDRQRRNGRDYFYCSRTCSGIGNMDISKNNLGVHLGVGDSSRFKNTKDEFTPFRKFLRSATNRHKEKGKGINIDLKYIKEIWDNQAGICAITGVGLKLENVVSNPNYSASIDRIDSSKGYMKDNIQFISVTTNYAKNQYSLDIIHEYFDIINNLGVTRLR